MNMMNRFFTIGTEAGLLLLSIISGKLLLILSLLIIVAVLIGGHIFCIIGRRYFFG